MYYYIYVFNCTKVTVLNQSFHLLAFSLSIEVLRWIHVNLFIFSPTDEHLGYSFACLVRVPMCASSH